MPEESLRQHEACVEQAARKQRRITCGPAATGYAAMHDKLCYGGKFSHHIGSGNISHMIKKGVSDECIVRRYGQHISI